MKLLQFSILSFTIFISAGLKSQEHVSISSPDKRIIFNFTLLTTGPIYNIEFKGKELLENSTLSLDFENGSFKNNLRLTRKLMKDTIEKYELFAGKNKNVTIHYNRTMLCLEEINAPFRKINIAVKIFNDGVAFRYEYPEQKTWSNYSLTNENSFFNLTGDPIVHSLFFPDYLNSHEGVYQHVPFSTVVQDTLLDMPALFEYPGNVYVAITEAALLDYAGMYLVKENNHLVSKLSPLPNQSTIKVRARLPHQSPWRVIMISDKIGDLIESNIITSLNEPCKIKDLSWLKPGTTTFPWWNGNVVPDTLNAPGNNFITAQYYIDFCSRNHISYHSVVEYGLHQWYMDDGISFQPGPHADVTTPVPGLDMKAVCDYAKSKGVGIRVWVHWAALYPKLDSAFTIFEKWGIQGMMVDFMNRDDQEMVNIQTEILQKAAGHHLHIQFHGAYKPTGINRTYPNEFTREGTLNYEADKWNPEGISPDHDITMPFTRGLAGSTDYHLGGFRAVPKNKFKAQYTRPLMLGTRCHMLAMYVVLENYLQMVCDYPAAYEGQAGFEFIKGIPTTWDETRVLDAKINEFIILARKKGTDWYIGSITNHASRKLDISFKFLNDGSYKATVYTDGKDTDENPNHILRKQMLITKYSHLNILLNKGGGTVIKLCKIN